MITSAQILAELGLTEAQLSAADIAHLGVTVDAVNAYVGRIPWAYVVPQDPVVDPTAPWAGDTTLGALILGSRLYTRRNSPLGMAAFTEEGGASYIARYDPDVDRLLRIGKHHPGIVA